MNKAELIRHEIEKRKVHNLAIGNPLFSAMAEEDIGLLCFIDSLQEEPVSEENLSNIERTVKNWKEPVSEEWIEELTTKLDSMSKEDFKKVFDKYAIDFNEEPVSDDLKKAEKEWLKPQLDKSYADYGETKMMELTHFDGYAMLDAIEFGAKWQKLQDMGITNKAQDVVDDILSSADSPLDAYATEVAFMMLPATLKESYHQTNRDRKGIHQGDTPVLRRLTYRVSPLLQRGS